MYLQTTKVLHSKSKCVNIIPKLLGLFKNMFLATSDFVLISLVSKMLSELIEMVTKTAKIKQKIVWKSIKTQSLGET